VDEPPVETGIYWNEDLDTIFSGGLSKFKEFY
jgi:hypothetical protein